MATLRKVKGKLDRLKQLEAQLDEKDSKIAELTKQVMMQEGAIQGWLDTIETKKRLISEKDLRNGQLESENSAIISQNADSAAKIKKLELRCADANAKLLKHDSIVEELKRGNESLTAQKH